MEEREFADIIREAGGRVFLVGGYVRDLLLKRPSKDRDYVICGLKEQFFHELFPGAKQVGSSFPVFLLSVGDAVCEVSFARRERKSGKGYLGFAVEYDSDVTIEEDLFRRDTGMNSIAMELPEGNLIDPYGGAEDIRLGRIRAVSEHFLEDPVRALRAARQAAELGFSISEDTIAYMSQCGDELKDEPHERILGEMQKSLASDKPSVFFRYLDRAGLLDICFPEIFQLKGKPQPVEFHPEGDAYEHVLNVVDEVAVRNPDLEVRFAALCHDLGKGLTPEEMLPHHYGHEKTGVEVLRQWNSRMTLPKLWIDCAEFVIREHMRAPRLEQPGKIVDLLMAIEKSKLSVKGFRDIVSVDHGGLPAYLENAEEIIGRLLQVSGSGAPEKLRGPKIAMWIRERRIRVYMERVKE
ncbi:MAG TPA: tRNA adenylyltransferase [Selenomonas sp.]|nr:HD domain-containing protein [Selenomonadaceae bacterium]HCB94078.1 tRNA adenylyltransferase [Selenomonas sp.]